MKSYILYRCNNIDYLYSKVFETYVVIHPVLKYILISYENGVTFEKLLKDEIALHFDFKYDLKTCEYYISKFEFLYNNGFFNPLNNKNNLKGKIHTNDIHKNFSNVRQLTFEVTENCNLECVYCGY